MASRTRPIAVSTARALFSVSAHSLAATESCTMPAPAWMDATPSWSTHVLMVIADGVASVQTGAGIVQDSVAASEWTETENKARAMLTAIGRVRDARARGRQTASD